MLKVLDLFFPSLAAKKVHQIMSSPHSRKLKKFEEKALASAEMVEVNFRNSIVKTYTWGGEQEKTVFLIHGWEGHAGNFGALIEILLSKGYSIVSFDAPSHGKSTKRKTSMFEFSEFVSMMMSKYRPSAFISHSFGSVTSIRAMSENLSIDIEKWLLITTPNDFKDRVNEISDFLGVSDNTKSKLIKLLEKEGGTPFSTMNMKYFGKRIPNVKDALIVHSVDDIVLSIDYARAAHKELPMSRLIEVEKVGHFNILWSDKLKSVVEDYM
ncbi:MAG: alpha/beta hydrolase [Bacteroidetes bacterium]|nr:alpha/beta hydrolase [Bacteroidota bacterium]